MDPMREPMQSMPKTADSYALDPKVIQNLRIYFGCGILEAVVSKLLNWEENAPTLPSCFLIPLSPALLICVPCCWLASIAFFEVRLSVNKLVEDE